MDPRELHVVSDRLFEFLTTFIPLPDSFVIICKNLIPVPEDLFEFYTTLYNIRWFAYILCSF